MVLKFMSSTVRIIISIILMITVYFLPSGIGLLRRHNNFIPILLVNLFFGITVIGWIIALIWSFTSNVKDKRSIQEILKELKSS